MFLNQACEPAHSTAASFLLGAGCAAVLVLSFAGASLTLSWGVAEARKPGLNELRLNRAPRPALRVGGLV